jgi:hypothetical protein
MVSFPVPYDRPAMAEWQALTRRLVVLSARPFPIAGRGLTSNAASPAFGNAWTVGCAAPDRSHRRRNP